MMQHEQKFLELEPESLLGKIRELEKNRARLIAITASDKGDYLEALYHFDLDGHISSFRVKANKQKPLLESIVEFFPSSELFEREASEMFGISFAGNPNPSRLFVPEDYVGEPPMLKKDKKEGVEK